VRGISIIIPTFNRQDFIEEAIRSVLDQEYNGKVELIISDDGSSDKTLEIAESFGDKLIILRKEKECLTQGASSTRNRGIKYSTQPYICFLDSDDYYLPGHLEKIAMLLELNPDINFCICRVLELKMYKGQKIFKSFTKQKIKNQDIRNPVVSANRVVCTNSFIFRRCVFDKVGVFNETLSNGEDGDMWMRISEQNKGAFSNHVGAVRRTHGLNQLTKNDKKTIFRSYAEVYKDAIKRYYEFGLKDSYRITKLRMLVLRYRCLSSNLFYPIYLSYEFLRSIIWKYGATHSKTKER